MKKPFFVLVTPNIGKLFDVNWWKIYKAAWKWPNRFPKLPFSIYINSQKRYLFAASYASLPFQIAVFASNSGLYLFPVSSLLACWHFVNSNGLGRREEAALKRVWYLSWFAYGKKALINSPNIDRYLLSLSLSSNWWLCISTCLWSNSSNRKHNEPLIRNRFITKWIHYESAKSPNNFFSISTLHTSLNRPRQCEKSNRNFTGEKWIGAWFLIRIYGFWVHVTRKCHKCKFIVAIS